MSQNKPPAQSLLNRCIMELQRTGVTVRTEHGSVTCIFPPIDPDDPFSNEKVFSESDFTLLVTRTFLALAEEGVIDAETGEAVV